jgi:hypothetical protein
MEDVIDDELFFGLLQANPQISGRGTAAAVSPPLSAFKTGPGPGLHDFFEPARSSSGVLQQVSTSYDQPLQGLWNVTQNQSVAAIPVKATSLGYGPATGQEQPPRSMALRQRSQSIDTKGKSWQSVLYSRQHEACFPSVRWLLYQQGKQGLSAPLLL